MLVYIPQWPQGKEESNKHISLPVFSEVGYLLGLGHDIKLENTRDLPVSASSMLESQAYSIPSVTQHLTTASGCVSSSSFGFRGLFCNLSWYTPSLIAPWYCMVYLLQSSHFVRGNLKWRAVSAYCSERCLNVVDNHTYQYIINLNACQMLQKVMDNRIDWEGSNIFTLCLEEAQRSLEPINFQHSGDRKQISSLWFRRTTELFTSDTERDPQTTCWASVHLSRCSWWERQSGIHLLIEPGTGF